jgi:hypothetical protein
MDVFSYYHDLRAVTPQHSALLDFWWLRWQDAGFNPRVLSAYHAQPAPDYEKYFQRVNTLPTVNVRHYETACWLRWLALAAVVPAGGFMVDWDVFPRPGLFRPEHVPCTDGLHLLDSEYIPCAVWMTADGFQRSYGTWVHRPEMIVSATSLIQSKPHVSDMSLIQYVVPHVYRWPRGKFCRRFHLADAGDFPLWHFASESVYAMGWPSDKVAAAKRMGIGV